MVPVTEKGNSLKQKMLSTEDSRLYIQRSMVPAQKIDSPWQK